MIFNNLRQKNFRRTFLKYTLILVVVFIVVITIVYYTQLSTYKSNLRKDLNNQAILLKREIAEHIETKKEDIKVISDLKTIKKSLIDENFKDKKLFSLVADLMDEKKDYSRFKVLNIDGEEVFKADNINGETEFISKNNLQDESNKEYYKKAKKLSKNEVYISEVYYRVDQDGKIKKSIEPTLRLISPIFIKKNIKGFLVINFLPQPLYSEFNIYSKKNDYNIYLLNNRKHFLYTSNKKLDLSKLNKQEKREVIGKLYSEANHFNINSSVYYKSKIDFSSLTEINNQSEDIIYLVLEMPREKIIYYKDKMIKNIVIYSISLFLISLILTYLLVCLYIKKNKTQLQLKHIKRILDQTNEGIIITNKDGVINYANSSFLNMFDYKASEVIGEKISKFKSYYHDDKFYRRMWDRIKNFGEWEGDIVDITAKDEQIIIYLKIEKVFDNETKETMFIGTYKDVTKLRKTEEKLYNLNYYDEVTGIPNINYITEEIERFIKKNKTKEQQYHFASLVLSPSNIYQINDSYGLNVGEKTLLVFVERIRNRLDKGDFLGQISDYQFVIITKYDSFESYRLKIRDIIKECIEKPYRFAESEFYLTLSAGISIYPDDGKTAYDLLEAASLAGKKIDNTEYFSLSFYSKELSENVKKRMRTLFLLKNAIDNNELYLLYQPKVNSKTDEVIGAEALIRWKNEELGYVSPGVFIPLAEESELIKNITEWVIKETSSQIKEWKDKQIPLQRISLNLSPYDFKNTDMSKIILKNFSKDISLSNIEIEITEGALVDERNKVIETIDYLKEKGIKFSIDDFGTGYSSLSYLKQFNIDTLKIDRSFIKDYPDKDDGSIVEAITNLASSLNLNTIAEGVETKTQLDFLSSLGCNTIQGFYYSKPVAPDELAKIFQNKIISPANKNSE